MQSFNDGRRGMSALPRVRLARIHLVEYIDAQASARQVSI